VARLAKLALGAAASAVLLFFAVFAALGMFWVALPIVMLGSAPAGLVLVVAALVLTSTGVLWISATGRPGSPDSGAWVRQQ
jgi:hypothetical protein